MKMARFKVQILTKKLVKPSSPTPKHLQKARISLFDQLAPPIHTSIVFHYLPNSEDQNTEAWVHERCIRNDLETSLSQVLTQFYPIAGRQLKDDLAINCNDEGVVYVEARVNANLGDILLQGPEIKLLNQFLPWNSPVPPDFGSFTSTPLLGVQVNLFDCGGLIIGLCISHLVADAHTMEVFITEWAKTCRNSPGIINTSNKRMNCPSDLLATVFPGKMVPNPGTAFPEVASIGPEIVTRRFVFNAKSVSNLRDRANEACVRKDNRNQCTRAVAAMALIWKTILRINQEKNGSPRDSIVSLAMNLRGKSMAPLLDHALGNFWMPVLVPISKEDQTPKLEFSHLASVLGSKIRDKTAEVAAATADEIALMLENSYKENIQLIFKCDEVDIYIFSSWCKFPMYEADFGGGKPFWISKVSEHFEGIFLIDTEDGNGIEAWISLKEEDMFEFERDADLLAFTTNESVLVSRSLPS